MLEEKLDPVQEFKEIAALFLVYDGFGLSRKERKMSYKMWKGVWRPYEKRRKIGDKYFKSYAGTSIGWIEDKANLISGRYDEVHRVNGRFSTKGKDNDYTFISPFHKLKDIGLVEINGCVGRIDDFDLLFVNSFECELTLKGYQVADKLNRMASSGSKASEIMAVYEEYRKYLPKKVYKRRG